MAAVGVVLVSGIEEVKSDAAEVFGYCKNSTHQERCHAYIERRQVARAYHDTATLCAVLDMVRRAYECGRAEATGTPDLAGLRAELEREGARLIGVAARMGAVDV